MNFIMSLMIASTFVLISQNFNPVKMSFMLTLASSVIFMKLYKMTGQVWFPSIFFMIFMGGILMMFMILSSTLPNEKTTKMKIFKFELFTILTTSIYLAADVNHVNLGSSIKVLIESSFTMGILLGAMTLYFFCMIKMTSEEELPMRSKFCCREKLIL